MKNNYALLFSIAFMALFVIPGFAHVANGQGVPVALTPSTITAGGSTTVSADISSLTFLGAPTYSWSPTGTCPDFPATSPTTNTFTYQSTATGITSTCAFTVSASDTSGNTFSGTSPTLTVNPATGQTVPIVIIPETITTGGSTTVSASVSGLIFSNPTYSWGTEGTCPDFTDPGNVPSFTYNASSTGLTSSCIFTVSVSDASDNKGSSGTSNEALIVNSATGQTVPVSIATNPIIAGKSTLVSASLSSLSFSNPVYSWSATGCPDFSNPGSTSSSFTYNAATTGITANCIFTVSVSDPYGNNGFGTSTLLTVSSAGSQTVPISISTNPITTGGSTTVAANVSGLVFSNPTYSWSTSGTCPDFTNPSNVQSFTYTASATGTTLGCTFTVSVSDSSDNTGSGATVDALVVNSATGQTVPVSIATNPITLNGSTTVSASVSGLVFSNPAYLWSITGCPDFVSPGSVSSFTYTASATGLTSDCVFTVSVTDTYGNTGTGVSAALAVNQPSQATTTSTSTTVNTTTTMAQQNATVQAQPVTTVPTITVPASAAAVVPAAAPAASSNNSYLIGVTGIVIVIVATLLYYRSTGRLGRSRRGRRHY